MIKNHKITIIGNGNVAWHLAFAFKKAGIEVNQIIGRSLQHAKELALNINSGYSDNILSIPENTTLILLCVPDAHVEDIAFKVSGLGIPFAHTAGSVPLTILGQNKPMTGVFYPFQTFTKNIRMGEVVFPVIVEASSGVMLEMLKDLASRISGKVCEMNSQNRRKLHLAGVLVNNFSNYLYSRAFDYLEVQNIDSSLMSEIIGETSKKINVAHPKNLQTGPARRGDKKTIEQHLELLANDQNLSELYNFISQNILEYYKTNNDQF